MKLDIKRLSRQVMVYCVGLFLLAAGSVLSVNSQLGVSPVNSLPYVISTITGVKLSVCVTSVFLCYILIQILLYGKNFRPIQLTQIIFSSLFGAFVGVAQKLLESVTFSSYLLRLVMLAVAIILVGCGIAIYLSASLVPMPMEGMTAAIVARLPRLGFASTKTLLDCVVVAMSIAISLGYLGKVQGIGIGTVLCALLAGRVMKFAQMHLVNRLPICQFDPR